MNVGERLDGKFRIIREIGVGAMASVWEAVEEPTSRHVAIKLMNRGSEDVRQRFFREARICTSFSHPNVVDVYEVGQSEHGHPFMVMQLLSGVTLAELLTQNGRLPAPIAAQIARDIALGLASAHAVNVVHRDLKPSNVFLHQEPSSDRIVVKVLDFGVAKVLGRADAVTTTPGGLLGSPGYMSPEQAQTRGDVDSRADIWALGVVLFEMLVGNRPFQGKMTTILMGILTQPIPRISVFQPDIDPQLDGIVARCMERNRDARIASATIVCELLKPFIRDEEGSRALMVLASRAILSAAQANTERSPDSVATRVPSSSENILPPSSKKGFDMTLPLPMDGLPAIGAKGTMVLVDKPSTIDGPFSGPRGTMRMIESSKLIEQVAEARRVIEIKLARETPSPPERIKMPDVQVGSITVVPTSDKRRVPALLIIGVIALVAIVGVALAMSNRETSGDETPNSGAVQP